jgi:hypothetical protein
MEIRSQRGGEADGDRQRREEARKEPDVCPNPAGPGRERGDRER